MHPDSCNTEVDSCEGAVVLYSHGECAECIGILQDKLDAAAIVVPEQPKCACFTEGMFGGIVGHMQPSLELAEETLRTTWKTAAPLQRGRARPSAASKAFEASMQAG